MAEHIVAIFDTEAAADAAVRDLEAVGIPAPAIRRYRPDPEGGMAAGGAARSTTSGTKGGFWAWLLGEEPSTETTYSYYPGDEERYVRSARSGNTVLSVLLRDDSKIHQVVTILEEHHPVEMDEDTDETDVGSAADLSSQSGRLASTEIPPSIGTPNPRSIPAADNAPLAASASGTEEVIPLAEEQLDVGKRTVDRGVTRVRRYVVERPIEQDVTLRGERVTIERRRPIETTSVPGRAFEERVVEVHETEEVPVVAKTARVVEEVAIRKEATERTETVRDTVRREDVEVSGDKGPRVSETKPTERS